MDLKIWHKMFFGISIPSLIVLVGGLLTYGYIANVEKRHGFVEIVDDIMENVLEVRRNEKNFLLHKNVEYHNYLEGAITVLSNSIDGISPGTLKEIGGKDFSLIQESIVKYSKLAAELKAGYQQEIATTEEVRTEGRKIETLVGNEKHAAELSTSFVLNLRRLEKNYMLFRDKNSFNELNNGLSQLKNITPFCYTCAPYIETIHKLFRVYESNDSLAAGLQSTGDEFETITNKIAGRERQKVRSFFAQTQRLLLAALFILCTLGPFLVYKTATYISTPIKRLAEITNKISQGDFSLRAPLKEHDETYSLAMSFNKMLDTLQLTKESLEKSMELLHEKQMESEKRMSLGFLISGVTHELNNPLNNISLTAETIKEDLNELTHEELNEYIQDILTQSERAKHIIEDLLDFAGARKSAGVEKLDIIGVLEESVNLIANQLRLNNISLNLDIPDRAFFIRGTGSKLEEVFINIFLNALHAMKDKGTLTVSAGPDNEHKSILIKISDTGHGIPENDLKNIFEPFFTTKAVGEGTGLGLSVSHGIIKEHKGDIEVESKLGAGSSFTIKLPLYKETG